MFREGDEDERRARAPQDTPAARPVTREDHPPPSNAEALPSQEPNDDVVGKSGASVGRLALAQRLANACAIINSADRVTPAPPPLTARRPRRTSKRRKPAFKPKLKRVQVAEKDMEHRIQLEEQ